MNGIDFATHCSCMSESNLNSNQRPKFYLEVYKDGTDTQYTNVLGQKLSTNIIKSDHLNQIAIID